MKKLSLFCLVLYSLNINAQDLPLAFTISEQASSRMGMQWDYGYSSLSDSLELAFTGRQFNITKPDGTVVIKEDVLDYFLKENKNQGKVLSSNLVIKLEKNNLIQYITISTYFSDSSGVSRTVSIPMMNALGQVYGYQYYR